MKNTLVVYFSRTGYTHRVADAIATATSADIEGVQETTKRSGLLGWFRSAREALRHTPIEVQPPTLNPRDYDLIVLGTPVWASNVSSPMRAYIAAHKKDFRRVAFFCTLGGSGAQKVLQRMTDLCGQSPVATAAFNDGEIDKGRYADKLQPFVAAVSVPKAA